MRQNSRHTNAPAISLANLALCIVISALAGCGQGGDEKSGFLRKGALFGNLFSGKKGKEDAEDGSQEKEKKVAQPRRIAIGAVHLVNQQAGFVLVKASRTSEIPEGADLFSYTPSGIPSGKLKLSPERKGAFLVADIIEGNPRNDEVVMFFGIEGADGEMASDFDPDAPQVLE